MERERALQEAKEVRRQLREREDLERQEAMRKKHELRIQQEALEAQKKRQEELDRLREEEQQRKLVEFNKHRELFYTAELERERKRHHTTIVKALEPGSATRIGRAMEKNFEPKRGPNGRRSWSSVEKNWNLGKINGVPLKI